MRRSYIFGIRWFFFLNVGSVCLTKRDVPRPQSSGGMRGAVAAAAAAASPTTSTCWTREGRRGAACVETASPGSRVRRRKGLRRWMRAAGAGRRPTWSARREGRRSSESQTGRCLQSTRRRELIMAIVHNCCSMHVSSAAC